MAALRRESLLTDNTLEYEDASEFSGDYESIQQEEVEAPKQVVLQEASKEPEKTHSLTPLLSSTVFSVGEIPLLLTFPAASLHSVSWGMLWFCQTALEYCLFQSLKSPS